MHPEIPGTPPMQVRLRIILPLPHVTAQSVHAPQFDHKGHGWRKLHKRSEIMNSFLISFHSNIQKQVDNGK